MRTWLRQLDELLRGKLTGPDLLTGGRVQLPLWPFLCLAILLGASYGFFMGWFSLGERGLGDLKQLIASTIKLPALFLLTLAITFPSLYVFNAIMGCRLDFLSSLRLLVSAITVNLAVAASFGPILGFFTLNTTSYTFMVLLNVLLLAIAGLIGLGFLLQTLRRLASPMCPAPPALIPTDGLLPAATPAQLPGPLDALPGAAFTESSRTVGPIFRIWLVIYALVGAQMGWILRPFIGDPHLPFTLFRPRESNFFQSVFNHLMNLFNVKL